MCVNNLSKVATQWNSGATCDSNRGRQVLISSALTTAPPSHDNWQVTERNQNKIIETNHWNKQKTISNQHLTAWINRYVKDKHSPHLAVSHATPLVASACSCTVQTMQSNVRRP